ncbi:MAG: flagellar hook assembly protein FlgD [Thiobacillaceae bacterium]
MSTIQNSSPVTGPVNGAASTASTSSVLSTSSAASMQNQFLTMLVAQLKNQDPLNPMDNSQITAQMAALSTVQGITDLNTTMQSMATALNSGQMSQAANLIGQNVLVPGNTVVPGASGSAIGMTLPSAASQVVVTIQNSTGQTVRTMNLGAQSSGQQLFSWDGLTDSGSQAAAGTYTFQIKATQGATAIQAQPLSVGQVNGVLNGGTGIQLQINNLGTVNYSDVQGVL